MMQRSCSFCLSTRPETGRCHRNRNTQQASNPSPSCTAVANFIPLDSISLMIHNNDGNHLVLLVLSSEKGWVAHLKHHLNPGWHQIELVVS